MNTHHIAGAKNTLTVRLKHGKGDVLLNGEPLDCVTKVEIYASATEPTRSVVTLVGPAIDFEDDEVVVSVEREGER